MPIIIEKIKIETLESITQILKLRYMKFFPEIVILLSYKVNRDKYFIFQEIRSFPLREIIFNTENNSIAFSSQWKSRGKKQYTEKFDLKIDKGSKRKKELETNYIEWDEIISLEERRYNTNNSVNNIGTFSPAWKVKMKDKQKDEYDAAWELRIENANRINTYDWGFEILSDTISLFAFKIKGGLPYPLFQGHEIDPVLFSTIAHTGCTFNVASIEIGELGFVPPPPSSPPPPLPGYSSVYNYYNEHSIKSYWVASGQSDDEEVDDFDIDDLVHGVNRKDIEQVGQINLGKLLELKD